MNLMQKMLSNKKYYMMSFLIPIILLILFYALAGYYPFGDKTVLVWDMEIQYISFFSWLNQVLKHQTIDSLSYSFSLSLGGSTVGLLGYYLLSPFNLLLLPFSTKWLPVGIQLVTMCKIGSCGVSMYHFLKKRLGHSGYGTILFSTMYALMGYVVTQQSNIMWLDGVILLPILMLQVYKLVTEGKWKAYPFWIMLAIVTDFYIAYMLILFSAVYFLVEELCCQKEWQWKNVLLKAGILIGATILGVGISAGIFIPVLYEIFSIGRGGSGGVLESLQNIFTFDYKIWFLPMKFLTGAYDQQQLTGGLPNIYVSLFCIPFVLLFFVDKRNKEKHKWAYFIAIGIMLLSFASIGLNQIWHGFTYTSGSNYRYSFCLTFLFIVIGYQQYLQVIETRKLCKVSIAGLVGVAVMGIWTLVVAYIQFSNGVFEFSSIKKWALTAAVLLCACLVIYLLYKDRRKTGWAIMTLVMSVELVANLYWSLSDFHYWGLEEYQEYTSMVKEIYDELKTENGDTFFRMEHELRDPLNDAMLIGYPSVTHYSSVIRNEVAEHAIEHHMLAEGYGRQATLYRARNSDAEEAGRYAIKYLLTYELPEKMDGWVIKRETPCYVLENICFKPLCYLETEDEKSKVRISIKNSGNIRISVTGNGEHGNYLQTSIPYRDGWKIMVDGREYREIPEDLMIGIELPEGDHEITLRYRQPMVVPGIVISAISLLLWMVLCGCMKKIGIWSNRRCEEEQWHI